MERRKAIKTLLASIGVAATSQTVLRIAQASQQSNLKNTSFFTTEQFELIKQLSQLMLPDTSTPGAVTLKLHHFVETMIKETFTKRQQYIFINGLILSQKALRNNVIDIAVQREKYNAYITEFLSLSSEQLARYQLFDSLPVEQITKSEKAHYSQYTFLTTLKTLLIIGFFTHEKIAKILRDAKDYPVTYQPG